MGLFLSSSCFWFLLRVLCSEREGRSSSRRLGSGSRSARKGSRDRNASGAWRLCRLASLVFRSALTSEHADQPITALKGTGIRTAGPSPERVGLSGGGTGKAAEAKRQSRKARLSNRRPSGLRSVRHLRRKSARA